MLDESVLIGSKSLKDGGLVLRLRNKDKSDGYEGIDVGGLAW